MSDLGSNLRTIQYYWRHAARYPFLLWGMILSVPIALLVHRFLPTLIVADILRRLATHDYVQGDLWGSFGPEMLLVIGMTAFGGLVLWRLNVYFNWKLQGHVLKDINQEVFDHLLSLSSKFHADNFGGALVSQTTKLANSYIVLTDTTTYTVSLLFWGVVFSSVLLWNKARLFVILLSVLAVLYVTCAVLITHKVRRFKRKETDAENEQTAQLADSITNVMAVKSFATEQTESKRFNDVGEHVRRSTLGVMFSTIKTQTALGIIGNTINASAVILAAASIVVYRADVAVVFLVFAFSMDTRENLWQFSDTAIRDYNRAFGDAQPMIEILEQEPGIKDPAHPEPPRIKKGAITFRSMTFTHGNTDEEDALFTNLNLQIKAGEKIGLVGHSGSGKTTLTRLLLRFSDTDTGEILIDGQNITCLTQADLRRHIAYVPQEPLLFHRTIRENIAYGKPGETDKEVLSAARKAHADDFVRKLPKGYDTMVGERGVKLSGGQRQRIAIARAILKDAPILVLDEATSALDSESEKLIQAALLELMKHRTTVVIAHRLSTVQKMDRIIVMDNGRIIEEGTHKQLLKQKGTYAKLWAHQSGGFLEE
jgi:ATP-binding cassette subfamily B protein